MCSLAVPLLDQEQQAELKAAVQELPVRMELEGNSNAGTSAAFLKQLRERHGGPLTVIWDKPRRTGARPCKTI